MVELIKNCHFNGIIDNLFSKEIAKQARLFHQKIPAYQPTPVVRLSHLAKSIGVKDIFVKDESKRFNLKAFKVLGGSFAIAKTICEKLSLEIDEFDFSKIDQYFPKPMVFTTATAGNHGAGIAWAAQTMGQKAVVYMPKNAAQSSIERIKNLGADCIVTNDNYDDTVRIANKVAQENDWVLVQDTAWAGYKKIPTWISQGYMTMADEAMEELNNNNISPSHIFLQAGVGAMAGGILGYFADVLGANQFKAVISEPKSADCLFQSAQTDNGDLIAVDDLSSIMAGLACGEVNPVTWPIIRNCTNAFARVEDWVTANGMRILGNPLLTDERVISGASGALTLGLLHALSTKQDYTAFKQMLGLNEQSTIIIFSTEGNTNPKLYQEVVWQGAFCNNL